MQCDNLLAGSMSLSLKLFAATMADVTRSINMCRIVFDESLISLRFHLFCG